MDLLLVYLMSDFFNFCIDRLLFWCVLKSSNNDKGSYIFDQMPSKDCVVFVSLQTVQL